MSEEEIHRIMMFVRRTSFERNAWLASLRYATEEEFQEASKLARDDEVQIDSEAKTVVL